MGAIASQITSLTIVYSTIYSDADQTKHQRSKSLAFVGEITGHKWPVTRNMFPFDDVIMNSQNTVSNNCTANHISAIHYKDSRQVMLSYSVMGQS